jgi:endonuclease-3
LSRVDDIFTALEKSNPNPKGELIYSNNFTLLIAVSLSAQSTDRAVNKVTSLLFQHVNTPEDLLDFGEDNLIESIKSIGLYRTKAKHLMAMARILIERYNSHVPSSLEDLMSLPGVGRKTALVIMNACFNEKVIAVDTHVFRVSNRLGLSSSNSVNGVENDLMAKVPEKYLKNAHHWLVLHGRYICKAKSPTCNQCVLMDMCDYYSMTKKRAECV